MCKPTQYIYEEKGGKMHISSYFEMKSLTNEENSVHALICLYLFTEQEENKS